jgi:hypothetical protein
MFTRSFLILLLSILAAPLTTAQSALPRPELVPIVWLERVVDAPAGKLPAFRVIEDAARVAQADKLSDNEAARFVRQLIARAWRMRAGSSSAEAAPPLPVVLQPGGNYARQGLRILRDGAYVEQPDVPYLLLDLNEGSLSLTFLHEGGHVVDRIVRGSRQEPKWSALLHSTFAVTDPLTALGEGYAIHLETLWGHYGDTPDRRSWYHRLDLQWSPERAIAGEFFAPVRDLMTFSQNWARYRSVRDGETAFEGHVYDDSYLRSQYSPSRDVSQLRNGNGMVASEGVVASVLFWIVDGDARSRRAEPQRGLHQPGVLEAELQLVAALQRAQSGAPPQGASAQLTQRSDLIDVVAAYAHGESVRRGAVEKFIAITRGTTAKPEMRVHWTALHQAAVDLDINPARALADRIDAMRREIVEAAVKDLETLRAGVGPLLPVRLTEVKAQLKALGEPFPVEFDLNAIGNAELNVLTSDLSTRVRIRAERDRQPFTSYEDFERRAGVTLASLRATRVEGHSPSR